jgi:hypothetical protein
MILRENDWYRPEYKNAIIHYSTKNQSFLKLAAIHRKMGVKHWYCCLALINPNLEFIDPHSPDLTLDQQTEVVIEMLINPWYFFREFVRVPVEGEYVPFEIHRGSFTLIWAFFNNIDIALLLIRQRGKTVTVACLLTYLKRILKGARTILITKDNTLRTETLTKMKKIRDGLPGYAWRSSRDDADNNEVFTYKARDNVLVTAIAQGSIAAAENAGRGLTCARLFGDEVAFIRFIRKMLAAALASGSRVRITAEERGIPYGNVFTTTPGKRDSEDGRYIYDMFHAGRYWDESMLDIPTRGELIDHISKNSTGDRVLIHAPFNHRQLGMTDRELYLAMANAGGTREEQQRDFGLQWTAGTMSSPISADDSKRIRESVCDPIPYVEIFKNTYCINWYYKQHEIDTKMRAKHIIGVDTSDAVGRDNIALVMINSETLETAATAIVNESNLIVFSNWLSDILVKYENTILVIERKSSAPTIIDSMLITLPSRGVDPSRRIFNRVVQERDANDPDLAEFTKCNRVKSEAFYEAYRKFFGFMTTGTKRKLLYGEVLQTAINMAGDKIKDKMLADELLALVVKDGRIDHKTSGNDDTVIAWLLAVWFMLFGNRLNHYGVSNRILMRRHEAEANGDDFDSEDYQRRVKEQDELSSEVDDICMKIGTSSNPYELANLRRLLRVKLAKLDIDTSHAKTVGELREIIGNEKLKSRYI